MLFSDVKTDKIRDHLIKLMESSLFCMRLLEVSGIPGLVRNKEAHSALYEALSSIVDENIATSFEFGFILDQVGRKLKPLISEGMLPK